MGSWRRAPWLRLRDRGRGLISFAFGTCGCHRVFAGTAFTSERSWRLMERVGMRKEAHFRKAHVPAEPDGPWIDSVRYTVLASEWPVHLER
jgi:RimJ/RimL family protein N-acetyltransferase